MWIIRNLCWKLMHDICVWRRLRKHDFHTSKLVIVKNFSYGADVGCYIVQDIFTCWFNSFYASNENLIFWYWYRNWGCSNTEQTFCLTTRPRIPTRIWISFGEGVFLCYCVSVHNNIVESFICKKAKGKAPRIQEGMCRICGRVWKISAECSLSVH